MEKIKTYYQQIKEIVLPRLESYKTDLLIHDKKILTSLWLKKGINGEILHTSRKTGTDLFVFDESIHYETNKEKLDRIESLKIWLLNSNDLFLYGINGTITEIDRDKAIYIIEHNPYGKLYV